MLTRLYKFLNAVFFPLICACSWLLLCGCSAISERYSNDPSNTDDAKVIAAVQQLLGSGQPEINRNDITQFQGLRSGVSLRDYADTIAMKLHEQYTPFKGVTVASFVNYDAALNNTHALGNQLTENLKTALTQVGYPVVEVNLAEQVEITETGNFVLTRNSKHSEFEFVVVGTMTHRNDGLEIDTKLVRAKSKKTYAAVSLTIPAFLFE